MPITLYELVGDGDRRMSPYCWRTRLALAHKGLESQRIAVKFTDKDKIAFSGQKLVPIIRDGETTVTDSWAIACYLDDTYPDRPSLFGGAMGRAEARFINSWTDRAMMLSMFPLIVQDLYEHVHPDDRAYFLETRGPRFDKPFAEVQKDRDMRVEAVRAGLCGLRRFWRVPVGALGESVCAAGGRRSDLPLAPADARPVRRARPTDGRLRGLEERPAQCPRPRSLRTAAPVRR